MTYDEALDSIKHSAIKHNIVLNTGQVSPVSYKISLRANFQYGEYSLHEERAFVVKKTKNHDYIDAVITAKKYIEELLNAIIAYDDMLCTFIELKNKYSVKNIQPISRKKAFKENLYTLPFLFAFSEKVNFENEFEYIEPVIIQYKDISEYSLCCEFFRSRNNAFRKCIDRYLSNIIKQNKEYNELLDKLMKVCNMHNDSYNSNLMIRTYDCYRSVMLMCGKRVIFSYTIVKDDVIKKCYVEEIKELFKQHIKEEINRWHELNLYIREINNCKNKLWKAKFNDDSNINLTLFDQNNNKSIFSKDIDIHRIDCIQQEVSEVMRDMLSYAEFNCGIRFLKEN